MQALRRCSGLIPPLKAVIDTAAGCASRLQEVAKHRKEYEELATQITNTMNNLADHLQQLEHTQLSDSVANIIYCLQKQTERINQKQARQNIKRLAEAEQDVDDLLDAYRLMDTLLRQLQTDAVLGIWSSLHEHIANTRLNSLHPANQSRYDSGIASTLRRRECTPNTRRLVLAELRTWANDQGSPKVYWMNGMAGTGKTTIACSFCAELSASHQLAASFFCSRLQPECHEVTRIIPTIAYQIARFSYTFQAALCKVLATNPDIGALNLQVQFEKLISVPMKEVSHALPAGLVVVIDALDECSDRNGAQSLLDLVFRSAAYLSVRFFVTCRPEPGLLNVLRDLDDQFRSAMHLHDIEQSVVETDIETYLRDELKDNPISAEQIRHLANRSGKLFIYAATAVRYIRPDGVSLGSRKRLDIVLGASQSSGSKAYQRIDELYDTILTLAMNCEDLESWEELNMNLVLHTVICAKQLVTVKTLAEILEFDDVEEVWSALEPLRSVLHVSGGENLVATLHASFSDYLLSKERSGRFYCDRTVHAAFVARRCIAIKNRFLHFNICNLESSFVRDADVPNLLERANAAISPSLFYSCQYWSCHLNEANPTEELAACVEQFLSQNFLFWLEVLSLKQCLKIGAGILSKVYDWLRSFQTPITNLLLGVQDALKFAIMMAANPVSESTPHIYISALSLWKHTSSIWTHYGRRMKGMVKSYGTSKTSKDSGLLAAWPSARDISTVAISSDGSLIASSSKWEEIHIRDVRTGCLVGRPFKGEFLRRVVSLNLSHGGTRVVSGSRGHTIAISDTHTGNRIAGLMRGHTDQVTSVAFSNDDSRIVSGSWDCSVRVWNAYTGNQIGKTCQGHTNSISSVSFSPDDSFIASGSHDCNICLWDPLTGRMLSDPFHDHTGGVTSVAFSPDGSRIVSGSEDCTIRIWGVHTRQKLASPLTGHTGVVRAVTYSRNGTRILSCSDDSTIRVWDAHTGNTIAGPLLCHTGGIKTVAFLHGDTCVVSGSSDCTIRIWDISAEHSTQISFEHYFRNIKMAAFSYDGSRVVSRFENRTVCVWDAITGDRLLDLTMAAHTEKIHLLAFSHDNTRIVSGSSDSTIRVWDACTGELFADPFSLSQYISAIAFSFDDNNIGVANTTHIRVLDAFTGTCLRSVPIPASSDGVYTMVFSRDRKQIAFGSSCYTIWVIDAYTGHILATCSLNHLVGTPTSLAFSHDGTRIATGFHNGTVQVRNVYTRSLLPVPLEGHVTTVSSVVFSQDDNHVISRSDDRSVRIWNVENRPETQKSSLENWTMDKHGWILGPNSELLIWVPADLRPGLKRPNNTHVSHYSGCLELDFKDALIGPRWAEAYDGCTYEAALN